MLSFAHDFFNAQNFMLAPHLHLISAHHPSSPDGTPFFRVRTMPIWGLPQNGHGFSSSIAATVLFRRLAKHPIQQRHFTYTTSCALF
jgi:hypothetical protein